MRKFLSLFIAFSISSLLLQGCKKDEDNYGPQPEIEFISISPGTVAAFSDSLIITIQYTDGDGDLGENVSGVENAFVTDTRTSLTYGLRIRQLAPDNANITIRGQIKLIIPALGHSGGAASESATFQVYVKDRAGNQSNVVTTTPVNVTP
jgi:hypothetical protein